MKPLYIHNDNIHNVSAARVIVPLLLELLKPQSILDVGCGTGTWLKVLEENGFEEYYGIDGEYVDRTSLKIPEQKFLPRDLTKDWSLNRKFDLVISLEVAEHLPDALADHFVSSIVSHGDNILFSAAIPGQGGQNHLNEQWPSYWQKKFARYGFFFHDSIRPLIWNDDRVEWWYKQNIFLLTKQKPSTSIDIMPLVHPDLFQIKLRENLEWAQNFQKGKHGISKSLSALAGALVFKLKTMLGR